MNLREYEKKDAHPIIETDELNAFRVNFEAEIKNNNIRLNDIPLKDSLNNTLYLHDFFNSGQSRLLVCRFSELNCESCVEASIRTLLRRIDIVGKENILFLGTYRNNKIFNRHKPLYGIDTLNVANAAALNLPAEGLGYPYYFVLDSTLNVLSVFVPDKGYPKISKWYLELVKERYFGDMKHFNN